MRRCTPAWRTVVALAVGVVVVAAATGCGTTDVDSDDVASTPTSPARHLAAPLLPDRGAYLGIYYGAGDPATTDRQIGTVPRIHLTYFGWSDDWVHATSTTTDLGSGRIPLVNWEPFDVDFDDIVAGRFDDMLTTRAREAAQLPRPIFLDFAAEMNEEEGWGGHDPNLYRSTWHHIHDIFTRAGATNVVWVWAPNNTDSADAPTALDYYPGTDYVDWTGIDGYNWGTSQPGFSWQSFHAVFEPIYNDLARLGKPIIIGETASDELGGDKAAWIRDIVPTMTRDFPMIKALVWFDIDKERHWQISSTPASLTAFTEMATSPFWQR